MARKMQIMLEDDLTGDVLEDGAGETVLFGLDGTAYEIDLSTSNAADLREAFARYTGAGRKVAAQRGGGSSSSGRRSAGGGRQDLAAIREWAKANGHEVSERGRIKTSVIEAYDAAH